MYRHKNIINLQIIKTCGKCIHDNENKVQNPISHQNCYMKDATQADFFALSCWFVVSACTDDLSKRRYGLFTFNFVY